MEFNFLIIKILKIYCKSVTLKSAITAFQHLALTLELIGYI